MRTSADCSQGCLESDWPLVVHWASACCNSCSCSLLCLYLHPATITHGLPKMRCV